MTLNWSHRGVLAATLADSRPANLELVYSKPNAIQRHWWTLGLPSNIWRRSLTLYHGTNYEVPLQGRRPTVLTIPQISPGDCILTRMKRALSGAGGSGCR